MLQGVTGMDVIRFRPPIRLRDFTREKIAKIERDDFGSERRARPAVARRLATGASRRSPLRPERGRRRRVLRTITTCTDTSRWCPSRLTWKSNRRTTGSLGNSTTHEGRSTAWSAVRRSPRGVGRGRDCGRRQGAKAIEPAASWHAPYRSCSQGFARPRPPPAVVHRPGSSRRRRAPEFAKGWQRHGAGLLQIHCPLPSSAQPFPVPQQQVYFPCAPPDVHTHHWQCGGLQAITSVGCPRARMLIGRMSSIARPPETLPRPRGKRWNRVTALV